MPGISFLFKKGFHPAKLDNQKRVFVAEQKLEDFKRREAEAKQEMAKEAEILSYEKLREGVDRDPRSSSLKFMYCPPTNIKSQSKDTSAQKSGTQNDPLVQTFMDTIQKSRSSSNKNIEEKNGCQTTVSENDASHDVPKPGSTTGKYTNKNESKLNREVGVKARQGTDI